MSRPVLLVLWVVAGCGLMAAMLSALAGGPLSGSRLGEFLLVWLSLLLLVGLGARFFGGYRKEDPE